MSFVGTVQPDLRRKRVNWQKVLVIVLFAIVPLFLLMLFTYVPFAKMIQFSFHNMSYTKDKGFVGLDNYLRIFTKEEYIGAMLLSLYYMAGAVVQLALALFLASVLSLERIRGSGIFKAILFFPFLVKGRTWCCSSARSRPSIPRCMRRRRSTGRTAGSSSRRLSCRASKRCLC